MTKAELAEIVWKKAEGNLSKKAATELLDEVFDAMALTIKKEKRFSYPGFGTWTVRNRKARKGRNPQTGETINIKASKTVGFKPAALLKGKL